MATYVSRLDEGNEDQKDLLGGKGANLAGMTRLLQPWLAGISVLALAYALRRRLAGERAYPMPAAPSPESEPRS